MKACPACGAENYDHVLACKRCDRPFPGVTLPRVKADRTGTIFLVVVSVLFGIAGLFFLSQATTGIGLLAFGCLLAILARISQAGAQHQEATATHPSSEPEAVPVEQMSQAERDAHARKDRLGTVAAVALTVLVLGYALYRSMF